MEMPCSIRGDKHEFCLVVNKVEHVRSCPSFDFTHTRQWSEVAQIFNQGEQTFVGHQQMNGA